MNRRMGSICGALCAIALFGGMVFGQTASTKASIRSDGPSVTKKLNEIGLVLLHTDENSEPTDLNSGVAVFWENGRANILVDGTPIDIVDTDTRDQLVTVQAESQDAFGETQTVFVSFGAMRDGTL